MRCNVGRFEDGSIFCCPSYISRDEEDDPSDDYWFSGVVPPPYTIKDKDVREHITYDYNFRGHPADEIYWKKENGWTVEMVAAVMKSAREMKE